MMGSRKGTKAGSHPETPRDPPKEEAMDEDATIPAHPRRLIPLRLPRRPRPGSAFRFRSPAPGSSLRGCAGERGGIEEKGWGDYAGHPTPASGVL